MHLWAKISKEDSTNICQLIAIIYEESLPVITLVSYRGNSDVREFINKLKKASYNDERLTAEDADFCSKANLLAIVSYDFS